MQDWGNYILSAVFFLIFCGIFYFWKLRKKRNIASGKQSYLLETLKLAGAQFETFNLKLPVEGGARNGYSALLEEIAPQGLIMDVNGFMPADAKGKPVDVFFRARRKEGPVFYAFSSVIRDIKSDYESSRILLAMPDHLRVEKKRHFMRVKPDKNDIRVIGVWPIKPGKKLPRSTSEIGPPVTHYKPGMTTEPVQVENISGAGLALRFAAQADDATPIEFTKGSQILCLVVYVIEEGEKPVAFWCTGEVMNSRMTTGPNPMLVVGLEFTNWAVLEHASSEIHWAHSSPSRGARPILQWVDAIEQKKTAHALDSGE